MKIDIRSNLPQLAAALKQAPGQVQFAVSLAINNTAVAAQKAVQQEMRRVFDRPTPWFINSLRVERGNKSKPAATVGFKAGSATSWEEGHMVKPHIGGGRRESKMMELRLQRAGLMPAGWSVVPGEGAKLDAYGNISRGQISLLLNVLGTYTEAGYNKANAATRAKLAKGTRKRYGVVYWVNPVGGPRGRHLQPGVYQRVATPFGSSLKPILIFVRSASYRQRLDFDGIVRRTVADRLPDEFDAAFERAVNTALLKQQGSLL